MGGIIGGIGGLIGGGISAAIKGENVLNGMISGAAGGAVGGAVAGIIVETFVSPATAVGSAVMVGAISGIAGGFASSLTTQAVDHVLNTGSMSGFSLDWQSVFISSLTGAAFNAVGSGLGQSITHFYNDKLLGAIVGGFFSIGNAIADDINAIYDSIMSQTEAAIVGKTLNPYYLTSDDLIRLRDKRNIICS